MITHVLDTSAILAHYFDEPGADLVNALLVDNTLEVGLPAVALLDLRTRLDAAVSDAVEARRAYRLYAEELITAIPVTRETIAAAEEILPASGGQLTFLETVAAATARHAGAVLVHRSPRLARLPGQLLQQKALPLDA